MRDFDWQILVTLNKTHNISKAAEQLYISQPAMTKRLQAMEDELGVRLLVRGSRGVSFTAEGERIAVKAETIVSAVREIRDDLAAQNSGAKGIIRLGVPPSYVYNVLPVLLEKYSLIHPGVKVDVVTGLSDELCRMVEDGTLQVAAARQSVYDSHLARFRISEDPVVVAAGRSFELEELPSMPNIEFAKTPMVQAAIQRWWNEQFSVPRDARFKVPTGDCCLAMIRRGLGYGFFSDPKYFLHEKEIYTRPLVFKDGTEFTRITWLLYNEKNLKNALVKDFVEFIRGIDINHLL